MQLKIFKIVQPFLKLALLLVVLIFLGCSTDKPQKQELPIEDRAAALKAWQDQKYSLFIHWGLYAIPAGVWEGEKITGYSEQIKGHARIPTEDYHKLAQAFNPKLWNPDSVALLAKRAGMKSIVITSKHHDGFSMFHTAHSEFNVVDATPYGRDVIKELSEACRRHGLKFGLYFSTIDWDFPGALPFESTRNSDAIPEAHHEFNLKQLRELLTQYGEISELWFDMGSPTLKQSQEMAALVRELQPNCMVSGRIWNDQGDFMVMGDNYTPDFEMGVPWQTPASMFDETWSYRSWQERGPIENKLVEKLDDLLNIVSSGGNFLLNIGPKGDGSLVPYEVQLLEGIGFWLDQYGEALYGTEKSPVLRPDWGYITSKPGKLYLIVTDTLKLETLQINGLKLKDAQAYYLRNPDHQLPVKPTPEGLEVALDTTRLNYLEVVALEYSGKLDYRPPNTLLPGKNGSFMLASGNSRNLHSYSGQDYYSSKPTVVNMIWQFDKAVQEDYLIQFTYRGSQESDSLKLILNDAELIDLNQKDSRGYSIRLKKGNLNKIELSREAANPHLGLDTTDLKLILYPKPER